MENFKPISSFSSLRKRRLVGVMRQKNTLGTSLFYFQKKKLKKELSSFYLKSRVIKEARTLFT